MSIETARWLIAGLGLVIPYLARVPRGTQWLMHYLETGWMGFLMISAGNLVACLSLVGISLLYKHPASLAMPAVLTLGFLAVAHFSVDLTADAQAGIALLILPVIALGVALASGFLALAIDRFI